MHPRGFVVDRATQGWVRATGRRLALTDHPWPDGPVGDPNVIGTEWLPREAEFRVYVDDDGTLRTDQSLSVWTIPILRFHSRLERKPPDPERSS